jgi:hypothetical protein
MYRQFANKVACLGSFQAREQGGIVLHDSVELQQQSSEFARWLILRMLYACRPGAASENIILRVLQSLDFDCGPIDVRQVIDYLQSAGLAVPVRNGRKGWRARLTPLGVAVVEYAAHAPSGISRPRRWRSSK